MTKISFVIPALNEETRVGRCVRSIKAELLRTGLVSTADFEIIVVDNGSKDATALVAAIHGAKVIKEPRRGVHHAKQTGFRHAQHDLIANIDADSMLREGWWDACEEAFRDPKVVAVSGPYRYFDLPAGKYVAGWVFRAYALLNRLGMTTMMGGNSVFRRWVLEGVGGYNTEIEFWGEDTWIALQVAKLGKVKFDSSLVVDSSGRRLKQEGYVKTFGRYLLNHFSVRLTGKPAGTKYRAVK